jgi:hypothetical protein
VADNVPDVVLTTNRLCPSGEFDDPSRKFNRTVDWELPSRCRMSGDADMVSWRPNPEGPASGGAS